MSEQNETASKERRAKKGYWVEIAKTIIFGVAMWFVLGFWAGYGLIYDKHEWGMYWILAMILVLPVVVVLAILLAAKLPGFAIKRGYEHPRRFAKDIVLLWFLTTLVISVPLIASTS